MSVSREYLQRFKMSRSRAEAIAREQAKHPEDIAQPGTALFEKAWGWKVNKDKENEAKRIQESKDYKEHVEAIKEHEARLKEGHPLIR